jgi:hypothetical protein
MLLSDVIHLDFNSSVPAFRKILIPSEKVLGCVFNQFCTTQILERIFTSDGIRVLHYEPDSKAQCMAWKRPISPGAKKFKINKQPVGLCLHFFGIWKARFWFTSLKRLKPLTAKFPYIWPNKEALKRILSSDEEVTGAVQNWLKTQPKPFF